MEEKKENQETKIVSSRSMNRARGIIIAAVVILVVVVVAVVAISLPKKSEAQTLEEALGLGEKYLSELDYEQAIASYRAAIEIDPKCVDAYIGLADTYIAMGEPEEALKVLEEAEKAIAADATEEDLKRILEKKQEVKHHIAYAEVGTLEHIWVEATCLESQYCSICEKTEGEALGHTWVEATCAEPKHCSGCEETEGEVVEHTWVEATCEEPKHCSVCEETEGEALEHTWVEATCTEAKYCSVCGEKEGEALGHTLTEANYWQPAICQVCGETFGERLLGQFEKYGLTCDAELDTVYLYEGIPCYENKDYTTTVKVTLSDYEVFESDETHEALEGYEWRTITCTYTFDDENAWLYGFSFNHKFFWDDYYDEAFFSDATVKEEEIYTWTGTYNGIEYSGLQCYLTEFLESGWIDNTYTWQKQLSLRLPKGFDSAVIGIFNPTLDFSALDEEGLSILEIAKENDGTILFRMK